MDGENFMENPIEMDDLGVPLFLETPIYITYTLGILGMHNLVPPRNFDVPRNRASTETQNLDRCFFRITSLENSQIISFPILLPSGSYIAKTMFFGTNYYDFQDLNDGLWPFYSQASQVSQA